MKTFKTPGFWYLPQSPEKQIAGILRFSVAGGLRLSLTGTFTEWSNLLRSKTYPLIHGVVKESPFGKRFTLVDCFSSELSFGMPGLSTEEIHANKAYAGRHLLTEADFQFDALRARWDRLPNWVGVTGINTRMLHEPGHAPELRIGYRRPEDVSFSIGGKEVAVQFGYWTSASTRREASVREDVSLYVAPTDSAPFEQINKEYLSPIRDFLTLACDSPVAPEDIVLYSSHLREPDQDRPSPIHFIAQPVYKGLAKSRRRSVPDMLFTYDDIKEDAEHVLTRWMEFSRRCQPFCETFFSSQYAPSAYVEGRFAALVHALVLYFQGTETPEQEFARLIDRADKGFAEAFAGDRQSWIRNMAPPFAELDLGWLLLNSLQSHDYLMEPLVGAEPRQFVDLVTTTYRFCNYCEPRWRDGAAQGSQLLWLTEKLGVLLKVCLLEQLGLPRDRIEKFFTRNAKYAHLKSVE